MGAKGYDGLLDIKEVRARIRCSRSSIYKKLKEGTFPQPVKIGARAVRWWESEIEAWRATRPRASENTPP